MERKMLFWRVLKRACAALLCLLLVLATAPVRASAEGEEGGWQLVGQTGGTTKALLAEGTTLYVGSGLHVLILDVSNPLAMRLLGTSPLLPDFVESIAADGAGRLYVSCGLGGLVALDVKNPAKPALLGALDTRGYTEGATLHGNYAVVADGPQGLQIVDVRDPARMKTISEAYPLAYAYDVAIQGSIAYVAGGGSGVFTVDLTDPLHPKEAGLTPLDGFTYDLELLGGKLYAACAWGGISVLNLASPLAPKRAASAETSGWAMALSAFGKDLLVLDGADGAMVYGVAPTALVHLSSFTVGGFVLAGAVSGTTAFVLDQEKGLLALDLTKKSEPALISRWMPLLDGWRVTIEDGACYVSGGLSGVHVYDLSAADAPDETFWYDSGVNGYVNKVILDDNKAYVAVNNQIGPFMVFDAADALHPRELGYLYWGEGVPVAPNRSLALGEGYIYAPAEWTDYAIDVRDPAHPKIAGVLPVNGPLNADCSGNLLVSVISCEMHFVDVSDPMNLKLLATLPVGGDAIRFINPKSVIASAAPGVWILDVSDPANPKKISELAVSGSVMDIFIDGSTAYLCNLGNGVQVVDLSDPTKPRLIETIRTPGLAYDCCVEDGRLIVADSYGGICVYRPGDPAKTAETGGAGALALSYDVTVPEVLGPSKLKPPSQALETVVTSAADAGPGSLRQALQTLRSGATITFDPAVFPADNPKTILLNSALPAIRQDYVTIDASNAGVILDGSNLPRRNGLLEGYNLISSNGLQITGVHNTVMGLQIYHFPELGINIEADYARIGGSREIGTGPVGQGNVISGNGAFGVHVYGWHCVVSGNLIGTDVTGTKAVPNATGLMIRDEGRYTTVGGTKPGEGNVISGNIVTNCDSFGDHTRIIGNLIGVDITGTKAVSTETSDNVVLECGTTGVVVGGTTPEERNIISGAQMGISFGDPYTYQCSVIGNYIGTDITGTKAIPNHYGVGIGRSGNHRIGGTRAGEANLISGNQHGVTLGSYGVSDNIVIGNIIGYDANGKPMPNNVGHPVSINSGQRHAVIGGYTQAEGNRIYGGSISIRIENRGIQACYIAGNAIDNPNGMSIFLEDGANHNFVQGNTFGKTGSELIRVDYGEGDMLRANTFAGGKPQEAILLLEGGNRALAAPGVTALTAEGFSGKTVPFGRVETYLYEGGGILPLGFTDADADGAFSCEYSELRGKRFLLLVTDAFGNTSPFSKVFSLPAN